MRSRLPISAAVLLAGTVLSACHSSPASPVAPTAGAPAAAAASFASGRVVDVLTGVPLPSVTVSLDGLSATTGADGAFHLTASQAGLCSVKVAGPGIVQRDTTLSMPAADASLSLIPAQFDLGTFDEMCRGDGALHRWTDAPALVIIDAVLQFTGVSGSAYVALDEHVPAAERASLATDLAWGLQQVTGGAISAFASVSVESPAPGASVNFFSRAGTIVVARFSGLSQQTGYWGYGRWARRGDAVGAGAIMIDRDFDAAGTPYTRSLRVHELGHALGYSHVSKRQSFMNPSAMYEPNDFDRDAARVAFQRPPGNTSPDRDPSSLKTSRRPAAGLVWGVITP